MIFPGAFKTDCACGKANAEHPDNPGPPDSHTPWDAIEPVMDTWSGSPCCAPVWKSGNRRFRSPLRPTGTQPRARGGFSPPNQISICRAT